MPRRLSVLMLIVVSLVGIAMIAGMVFGNTAYTRRQPVEKQFLVPWLAARTYLQYGISPYDEQATQRAQIVFYGRLAEDDEDPLRLATPLPLLLAYLPLALIQDYAIAMGVWLTFCELGGMLAAWLCLTLCGWKLRRWLVPVYILLTMLWVYAVFALFDGSPALIILPALFGAIIALRDRRDELAGALLVITLLKPLFAPIAILYLFWWTASNRRWRGWTGFLVTLGLLVGVSFFLKPDWFIPFLRGVISQTRFNPGITVAGLLAEWWPSFGLKLSLLMTILAGLVLFLEFRALRNKDFLHFLWTTSLVIAIGPLIGIPMSLDGFTTFILPLTLIFTISKERWKNMPRNEIGIVVLGLILLSSWVVFDSMHLLYLPLPVLSIIGLYWIRWWVVQPPRTWADSSIR